MIETWIYTLVSVLIVSLISFVGLITFSVKIKKINSFLIYLVSFSAGALFGDAFLHLIPEISQTGYTLTTSYLILTGIALFFVMEKLIHWQHCHHHFAEDHVHPFALMNLIGDGFHNFLDGLIIGASYLVNIQVGIATTIAVSFHEIPQEIGDFGILIHGGFSKAKALLMNFLAASLAVVGAVIALVINNSIKNIELFIIPIAVGGFIYIAGSDLIPELHKEFTVKKSILQLIAFTLGILIMAGLLFLG